LLLPITVQAYKAKVHEAAAKDSWYAGSTTPWLERVYGDAKRALPRAMSGRGSRGNLELGISSVGKKLGCSPPRASRAPRLEELLRCSRSTPSFCRRKLEATPTTPGAAEVSYAPPWGVAREASALRKMRKATSPSTYTAAAATTSKEEAAGDEADEEKHEEDPPPPSRRRPTADTGRSR